jgi:hypothetical protein
VDVSGNNVTGYSYTLSASGVINALSEWNGQIYVGGSFTSLDSGSGAVTANNIAVIDPDTGVVTPFIHTSSTDNGVNGAVYAISQGQGDVIFIGGAFTASGGSNSVTLYRVGGFDTVNGTWDASVRVDNGTVKALRLYNDGNSEDQLVVGGNFSTINTSVTARGVFQYNLTTPGYSAIGSGYTMLNSGADVTAIAHVPNDSPVSVGGTFTDGVNIINSFYFDITDSTIAIEDDVGGNDVYALSEGGAVVGINGGLIVAGTIVPSFTDSIYAISPVMNGYYVLGSSSSPYLFSLRDGESIQVSGVYGNEPYLLRFNGTTVSVIGSVAQNTWWVTARNGI